MRDRGPGREEQTVQVCFEYAIHLSGGQRFKALPVLLTGGGSDVAFIFNTQELLIVQRGPDDQRRDLGALFDHMRSTSSPIADVYRVLDAVVMDFIELGAEVERELKEVETEVYDTRQRGSYTRIWDLRKRIGRIDRAASGMADALHAGRQEIQSATDTQPALRPYFLHLEHDATGVSQLAAAEHASLDAVVSSHASNVASRQNQDMRTISAFAALLAIPAVLASIFGMNFINLPWANWEFGWLAAALAMLVLDVIAFAILRHRGWLGRVNPLHRSRPI